MIYLIDDKQLRQEKDYNWTEDRFKKYQKCICPIYKLDKLEKINKEVFQEGNIILYHESFLDQTQLQTEAVERRKRLEKFSENKSSYLVFFGGGKEIRDINDNLNVANMPVSVLYKNLEVFIQKYCENDIKLEYLLFGENPKIEETLLLRLQEKLSETFNEPTISVQSNNLFIRPSKNNIKNPLRGIVEKTIFNKSSDEDFSEKISEWLNDSEYDNIFLPLCFGNTLSDFNGLRLATHIRCTETKNQTTTIYIYSFVGIEYLLDNEYFNILRTKNVFLIPFSKRAIGEAAENVTSLFSCEELPKEIAKLKLDIPKNYTDNHSIANEWGLYQLARNANINIAEVNGFNKDRLNSIYFKYLIAKNSLNIPISEEQKEEQREYTVELRGLRIKGKIDLSKIK